ncbi:hypothetical protein N7492_001438 [Penicillium capsulatum]|uniref:Lysozyme n=1 Tax=Penicillium capsulatum TaxID=69766 RepID=A0A9W9ITT2_9EURO|nr:hypothetical protein N7492_001438 [Penicillium capsulatum]KAJ6129509.1 hypothetical protein N7512_002289 [Penicillium capsulatum]
MKFTTAVVALFAASAMALPTESVETAEVEKRAAVNDGTLELIGSLEGFRPNFYTDTVGHKAIGYGHDCPANGDCGSLKAPISKAEGKKLLAKDIKSFESCVCKLDNAKELNANQYGALVSFAFNSGCGGVQNYWHGAMAKKNFKGICEALPNTNTLNGMLNNRRAKEGKFCSTPTNEKSGC